MKGELTVAANKEEKIGGFNKWEVSQWLSTLTESEELKRDKKKMAAVLLLAKKKEADTARVASQLEAKVSKKMKEVF